MNSDELDVMFEEKERILDVMFEEEECIMNLTHKENARRRAMASSAREEWETGEHTKANAEVILQEIYEELVNKGEYVDIGVIEKLTGIQFIGLNQLIQDRYEESYEAWKAGSREQEHASVLLQDVYAFLDRDNRQVQIEILEEMTGEKYG